MSQVGRPGAGSVDPIGDVVFSDTPVDVTGGGSPPVDVLFPVLLFSCGTGWP